jgi:hypothetical protein
MHVMGEVRGSECGSCTPTDDQLSSRKHMPHVSCGRDTQT